MDRWGSDRKNPIEGRPKQSDRRSVWTDGYPPDRSDEKDPTINPIEDPYGKKVSDWEQIHRAETISTTSKIS